MWPAGSRFGVLAALGVAACWTGGEPPAVAVAPEPEVMPRDVTGPYWCTIREEEGDEAAEPDPCVIRRDGGKLMLLKLAGVQRVRGQIVLDDRDGFRFIGEMFCPDAEDCDLELRGRFRPTGRGGFKGAFHHPELVMRLVPAPPHAFEGDDEAAGGRD